MGADDRERHRRSSRSPGRERGGLSGKRTERSRSRSKDRAERDRRHERPAPHAEVPSRRRTRDEDEEPRAGTSGRLAPDQRSGRYAPEQRDGHREDYREQRREQGRDKNWGRHLDGDKEQHRDRERHVERALDREGDRGRGSRDRDADRDREVDRDRDRNRDREVDRDRDRERGRPEQNGRGGREGGHEYDKEGYAGRGGGDGLGGDRGGAGGRGDGRGDGGRHREGSGGRGDRGDMPPPHGRSFERGGSGGLGQAGGDERAPAEAAAAANKEAPNMELSGKLAAEANKVAGTVLKYTAPGDAAQPDKRWRLYVFKAETIVDQPIPIHRMDHYLFGRDISVADIITAHLTCSKQHAVLQFRRTSKADALGLMSEAVRPYLIDLGSGHGTFLNGERIEAQRYYELLERDNIRFALSTREYILLHEEMGVGE